MKFFLKHICRRSELLHLLGNDRELLFHDWETALSLEELILHLQLVSLHLIAVLTGLLFLIFTLIKHIIISGIIVIKDLRLRLKQLHLIESNMLTKAVSSLLWNEMSEHIIFLVNQRLDKFVCMARSSDLR